MALTQLAENLFVHHGAVNVGILRDGCRALLIDVGDGDIQDSLVELGIERIERILLTHHHRDQASGIEDLEGVRVGVPAAEEAWLAHVDDYWANPAYRWHIYDMRPQNLMLPRPIPVHELYREGDRIEWGGATIAVLETPGHTDGSLSYVLHLPGTDESSPWIWSGDLIYGPGQIWDLYSLQKGNHTRDYHGFMGDYRRLLSSLQKLVALDPVALIPSHGPIIAEPAAAVDLLRERLDVCYREYVGISALRLYFPGLFAHYRDDPLWMPIRESYNIPSFLRHTGTTWVVVAEDGAALALDCGSQEALQAVQGMQERGEIGAVEWLWITHYHDDHVDWIPQFQEVFGCPVIADEHVAMVVEDPPAWRLPCLSPVRVRVDRRTAHGTKWTWHEFTLTAYHLPGQTMYHGGLLVEGRGNRVFFAGDSFTVAGIDDYCPGNRNLLGAGQGFDACLTLLQDLAPDLILNSHVDVAFCFSPQEVEAMRANLAVRENLYRDLLPWDDPNYGLDEQWVRCYPYEQQVTPGEEVQLQVQIDNHSPVDGRARCRPLLPAEWNVAPPAEQATIPAHSAGAVELLFSVPLDARPGRWIIPISFTWQDRSLGPFREAVLLVMDKQA